MPVDTILYNTKVCIHGNLIDAGIAIDEGKIVKIAKRKNLPFGSQKINLNGNITLPGLVDVHVHLRDQQLSFKETFTTGTAAAAAGGVTSVIDMPNNRPLTMNSISLKERVEIAKKQILVNVGFNSLLPKNFGEISNIIKCGAVGFKVYLSDGLGGIDVNDDKALFAAFQLVAENGFTVSVHAEDNALLISNRKKLQKAGKDDVLSFVSVHSPESENRSVKRVISLIKNSMIRIHFCHVSSALALNTIDLAKKAGLNVTCESTPHNLLLSSELYPKLGFFGVTVPPLRTEKDAQALWGALKSGLIDIVASDHAPHTLDEKCCSSVWNVAKGVPGLETTLPLLLNKVNKGDLLFSDLVRVTSERPAKIFGLDKRGSLEQNNWADLVVVDMKKEYVIDSSNFFSKAKYSPFDGQLVKGKPIMTFVNGLLVMNEGDIIAKPGTGCVISSKKSD